MRTFHQAILLGLGVALSLPAADPPPEIDAALRSRIQGFYQSQVDRKFREAEEFVAADTKDFFYGSKKIDILAFKITEIRYGPDFQSAKVKLSSRMRLPIPGAMATGMEVPILSDWKIDDGKWCWYVDQSKLLDTPFGRFNPAGASKPGDAKRDLPKLESPVSPAALMDAVHADPVRVHLDPDNPQPQIVVLKNTLQGPVTIQSSTNSPALNIVIAKPNLGAGESTEVRITPVAANADRPAQVFLKVGPTGQTIRINLDYSRSN